MYCGNVSMESHMDYENNWSPSGLLLSRKEQMIFFTSDLHFGHENIIRFCDRPFKSLEDMNNKLITMWNERVRERDTVYHVGDFAFKTGLQGGRLDPFEYEQKLNGTIVHIMGNHDKNNHLRNTIYQAKMKFGNHKWILQHKPPIEEEIKKGYTYLVGHVHEKWKFKIIEDTIIMNVGVDVNNFRPIKLPEVIVQVDRYRKESL